MPISPKLKELIAIKLARTVAPQWQLPIGEVRASFRAFWTPALTGTPPGVNSVEDRAIEAPGRQIPLRLYRPEGACDRPMLIYLHPGGYVKGGIEESDVFCRRLAAASRHVVASVGYRLAPEHRFPAALEDAFAAARWAAQASEEMGAQAGPIVMCGESAGGNLAAAACLVAREKRGPGIAAQVLIQPVLDFTLSCSSVAMPPEECLVPKPDLAWYYSEYLGGATDPRDPRVSPLWADDLRGLPAAVVLTAQYDSLRDEGEAYAVKLREAGVRVTYTCWPGMIHGFLQMAGVVEDATRAIDEIATFLSSVESAGQGIASRAP